MPGFHVPPFREPRQPHHQHGASTGPISVPSYMKAYHRRRTAAACTAIRAAASACLRQRITPASAPEQANAELETAWNIHLGFNQWQDSQA
jgi:hypothetical protein